MDQLVLVSATAGSTLLNTIGPAPVETVWTKRSPSHYDVSIPDGGPATLFLPQRFHERWEATGADGRLLDHYPAGLSGWANAFRVPPGTQQVTITFAEQRARDLTLSIWFVAWGATLLALAMLCIVPRLRRRGSRTGTP